MLRYDREHIDYWPTEVTRLGKTGRVLSGIYANLLVADDQLDREHTVYVLPVEDRARAGVYQYGPGGWYLLGHYFTAKVGEWTEVRFTPLSTQTRAYYMERGMKIPGNWIKITELREGDVLAMKPTIPWVTIGIGIAVLIGLVLLLEVTK